MSALKVFNKPYIVSLSGLSLEDNLEMLSAAMGAEGVDAVELNLACPNIPGKPIIAYDFEEMDRVLAAVTAVPAFGSKPFGVKLAPYLDVPHFDRAAAVLAKYPLAFVTTMNTLGNALFVDADNECASIRAKDGFGGLGGGYVKHTALANVRLLSQKLAALGREDISVVGVGGVASGRDAFELILCGAAAVQVGTCFWTEGPACFERIARELEGIMAAKGYTSIDQFRGRLKPFVEPHKGRKESPKPEADELTPSGASSSFVYFLSSLVSVLVAVIVYLLIPFSTKVHMHSH